MTSLNDQFHNARKRPRDDASAAAHDDDSIKRMRATDLDYSQDLTSAYMPSAYDNMSSYNRNPDPSFAAYPHMAPAQSQSSYWGMPAQRPPQPQPQPQTPVTHQYYNMPADPVSNLSYSGLSEWWQPRPSVSYNSVFDAWNYQIDEPCVYGADASQHLKLQSLSTLDNLSTQIILNMAKGSLNDILLLTAGRDHEGSQAYFTRRTLFDQTRKVYSKNVFIDMQSLPSFTASQQEVVRKANRAIFISSILEGHDVSFFDLDSRFLETFICPGQRLLKWQGTIFLELKTQAYIAALSNNDGTPEALLEELFPNDLPDQVLARHPDAPNLAPSEQDFLDRARARKQYLYNEPVFDAVVSLPRKYGWHDFLREFAVSVNKNVEAIISNPARTPSSQPGTISPSFRNNSRRSPPPSGGFPNLSSPGPGGQDVGSGYAGQNNLNSEHARRQGTPSQHIQGTPDVGQSTSSPKARTKPAKAGGGSTQRQPWKQEEEDALMAGLAEVKGPHWSQILSLYGRGGSVSEVLKDRNQIQLKDKARNLKLYYLKMGKEVPECLRGVTGELRKRGGARVRAALGLTDDDDGASKKASRSGTPLDPTLDA